jgi:hypothetical protein
MNLLTETEKVTIFITKSVEKNTHILYLVSCISCSSYFLTYNQNARNAKRQVDKVSQYKKTTQGERY